MTYNQELEQLRLEINQADEEIIAALAKRLDIVKRVGKLKKQHNVEPLDESRWRLVVNKITNLAEQNDVNPKTVIEMYEILHMHSLELES